MRLSMRPTHSGTAARLLPVCLLLTIGCVFRSQSLAQAYSRAEVGLQGASVILADPISHTDAKGGFGTRFTYNFSPLLALDAEGDFFPVAWKPGQQRGGRAFTVLVGPKAAWRWHRLGLFAKVRPGIVNFSNILQVKTGVDQSGIFPGGHVTHFALDLGGGVEIKTSRRTFIRVDISEMLLRYGDRVDRVGLPPGQAVITEGVIGNSLLATVGLSYRLGEVAEHSLSTENAERWEVGAQYSMLSLGRGRLVQAPDGLYIPLFLGDDRGVGGRVTYNFNRWLAIDSTINYFYTDPPVGDAQRGGKILQVAAGPKAGIRTRRYGAFAKLRPGFLSYGSVHDNNFPPFPTDRLTYFALDIGGVLEYYPSKRTMFRFDMGRTAVFYGPKTVVSPPGPPFNGNFVETGFRDHGIQLTTGFGWRF